MKLHRILLALTLLVVVAGLAYVAQSTEPAGLKMVAAAEKFLATLPAEQKARVVFAFDHDERTNWHFVPRQDKEKKYTRKGLPLEEMTLEQRAAALALVRAGTSARGYEQATTIMSLEAILRDLEKVKGGAMVRNPDWYFFSIFGTPGKTGRWGWRIEGHHLSLNFVVDGGQLTAATPFFFGANPATVLAGDRKGLRTLAEAEDLAKALFDALDDDQKKAARQDKHHAEIEQAKTKPTVGQPVGLPAAKLNDAQRQLLEKLLRSYLARMPAESAEVEWRHLEKAGIDRIHVAYAGGLQSREPYTYRIQGPTFLVEFLNIQGDSAGNPANHIHSSWRKMTGDFGLVEK